MADAGQSEASIELLKTEATPAGFPQRLEQAIEIVDDAVAEVRNCLSGISQAESERRPSPEAWSVGEIVHHLALVIARAGNLSTLVGTQAPDRFDYSAILAQRQFKLPEIADAGKGGKGVAPEGTRPTHGGNIQDLLDELSRAWQESKRKLRTVSDQDLSRYYYEHYRLGPLNLYETIAFHGYHARKHLGQIQRTLAAI